MATDEIPWWAKTAIYIAIPVGVLYVAYRLLIDYFTAPLSQLKDLWQTELVQYNNLLAQYAKESGGNLTPDQLTVLDKMQKNMQQKEATYVQIAQSMYGLVAECFGIAIAGLIIYGIISRILDKVRTQKDNVQTSIGQTYVCALAIADDLASKGFPTEATALMTTLQSRFTNVTSPFMQSEILRFQESLPTLVGWELIYAEYMIQAYTVELTAIASWFTLFPPPV